MTSTLVIPKLKLLNAYISMVEIEKSDQKKTRARIHLDVSLGFRKEHHVTKQIERSTMERLPAAMRGSNVS